MRGIFGSLTMSDSPPDDNSSNATEETVGMGSTSTNTEDMLYYTGNSPEYDYGYDSKAFGTEQYRSGHFP